jgi:hypothetical protein
MITNNSIQTPRGMVVANPNGKAELKWNTNFRDERQTQYDNAQKYVDSEVLRLSEPYIPLRTGMLIQSGILGTEIGSGEVKWIAPYAKSQYYLVRKVGSETGALRGSQWFQRMKETHIEGIVSGAKKIAGGGNR